MLCSQSPIKAQGLKWLYNHSPDKGHSRNELAERPGADTVWLISWVCFWIQKKITVISYMAESFAIAFFTNWGDSLDLQYLIKEYTVTDDKVGVTYTSPLQVMSLSPSMSKCYLLLVCIGYRLKATHLSQVLHHFWSYTIHNIIAKLFKQIFYLWSSDIPSYHSQLWAHFQTLCW